MERARTRVYELPWPPCVNNFKFRRFVPKEFRESVRAEVWTRSYGEPLSGRLACVIEAHPPTRRRRDLDNISKAPLDALVEAGAFVDDSQIDDLRIVRRDVRKPGKLVVTISEL